MYKNVTRFIQNSNDYDMTLKFMYGGFHILRKHIFRDFWPPLPPLISSFSTINKHILGNFWPPLPPQGAYVICERPLRLIIAFEEIHYSHPSFNVEVENLFDTQFLKKNYCTMLWTNTKTLMRRILLIDPLKNGFPIAKTHLLFMETLFSPFLTRACTA